jgi:pimeloyl-ACP methyl ester carboxylesterase
MLVNFKEWRIYKLLTNIALKIYCSIFANLLICFVLYMFFSGFLAFLTFLALFLAIFYNAQDNVIYHPYSPAHSRIFVPVPSQFGLPFESVNIKTRDSVNLHAYFIRHPGEKGDFLPTMIYFHGNAGNAGHRLQNANGIYHNLQCNVLLVEYRGYGLSTGYPSEKGIYVDARSSIDYLFTRHDLDHSQIVLFGRSLGELSLKSL